MAPSRNVRCDYVVDVPMTNFHYMMLALTMCAVRMTIVLAVDVISCVDDSRL